MIRSGLPVFLLFVVVSSRNIRGRLPLEWGGTEDISPRGSATSQVLVIEMHYDCQGRLIRQEAAKLQIVEGLFRIPGEEDLLSNIINKFDPLPLTSGEESNDIHRGVVDMHPQSPFKSMSERIRSTPKPTVEGTTAPRSALTKQPEIKVGPDTVIDVPVRACPEGENVDNTGRCRPISPAF